MALTYGFYNSIEGDRVYDAIQFGRIFDGIIKDGVYATYEKGMMVIASSNPAEVIIQPGRAWFNHTWSYNDANVIFDAPAPEVLLERIDALVLEINEELSSRENSFKWVQGTPSSRPERPTLTNTSTIHQYPLCYVHRYPETTMIYTRDITNMIGTSECPFATGVLEGIDLDAWINQWDDEFHTWENSKKTQFEAWMLSQETAFTTWYNAFKDQMEADVQEVEDFVAYLKTVLDESTAVHLQEEIDDLRDEISSGSHITVTTINSELFGRNVTITESGGTVFTEKFDNTGVAVFKSVPYVGNLTISSTYGTQTAERVVNTPYYARYEFAIAFWAATVNIVGDPEMSGYSVTVKDSEEAIVGTVVLDSEGAGVYTAIKPDTYKFTLTYGGETMEVTLSVTQETTYTVDLHAAGFKWQDWLEAGGVTGSYSSLDDVLADEVALRRLFTVHASVDYMAGINRENEDVEKIIGTDLAAKWINLRDYALDTLYANEIIAGYMDEADKYGYGEWALLPQVPTMTSNTAPYGSAEMSAVQSTNYAYYAFDNNSSTYANTQASGGSAYIGYIGVEPKVVTRVHYKSKSEAWNCITGKIQGYDGTSWEDITDVITFASGSDASQVDKTVDFVNTTAYLGHRLLAVTKDTNFSATELQFYAWQPKGNVPIMTSNSAPYGEASLSGTVSNPAYIAFNGDVINSCTASGAQSLTYKFTNPVNVKRIKWIPYQADGSQTFKAHTVTFYGSNDNSTWTTLGSKEVAVTDKTNELTLDIPNNTDYFLYYKATPDQANAGNYTVFCSLQYYGRELSVSVPAMTGNTTPYGEASASSEYSSAYAAWKAFDNDSSSAWDTSNLTNPYLQYAFTSKVKLKMFRLVNNNESVTSYFMSSFKIQGSNTGNSDDWHDLTTSISRAQTKNLDVIYSVDDYATSDDNDYSMFRLVVLGGGSSGQVVLGTLQFYGLDYSEKEFEEGSTKKWLYDHGVELENLRLNKGNEANNSIIKQNDQIILKTNYTGTDGNTNVYSVAGFENIDFTPYTLFRCAIGNQMIPVTSRYATGNVFGSLKVVTDIDTACPDGGSAYQDSATIAEIAYIDSAFFPNKISLDVSSLKSIYDVFYGLEYFSGNHEASLSELWLE